MGTKANKSYDHPDFLVTRVASYTTVEGNGTIGARFRPYINAKLIAVHAVVVIQGVAGGNDLVIDLVGTETTALGTFSFGTNAPLIASSITALDQVMGLGDEITVTHGTSTVGASDITYEYRLTAGGTFST